MLEKEIIQLFYPESVDTLDDCSLLPSDDIDPASVRLITTDSMAENTHFKREWSGPADLATKLYQSNLSDICASGGEPEFALLNLGLPEELPDDFLETFAKTLRTQFDETGCRLIGGDTFRSADLQLCLTLGGRATRLLSRAIPAISAGTGAAMYLTGDIGLSLAGFRHLNGDHILEGELKSRALNKHLRPRARLDWSRDIRVHEGVFACMDLSDGLTQDSLRLAKASRLRLILDLDRIPMAPGLKEHLEPETALGSGEEYELLFLGEPGLRFEFPCTEIGTCESTAGEGDVTFLRGGKDLNLSDTGFRHF